jgi:hypothetical protein
MSFVEELEQARELARRHRELDGTRGGLEFDEDHGGPLGPMQLKRLREVRAEQEELSAKLTAFFERAEASHPRAFRDYLTSQAHRLRALAASKDGDRFAAGDALYTWEKWAKRESAEDLIGCFTKGEQVLHNNAKTIDKLMTTTP